jgi:hypothetical protein
MGADMLKRIEIEFEKGGKFTAVLSEDEAPETCAKFWDSLPIEGLATQARYSGEEFFFRTNLTEIQPENQRMNWSTGDMTFNPEPSYRAVLFYYGHNLRLKEPWNPLGRIENEYVTNWGWPLDKLKEVGERVWLKGQEKVFIRKKEQQTPDACQSK